MGVSSGSLNNLFTKWMLFHCSEILAMVPGQNIQIKTINWVFILRRNSIEAKQHLSHTFGIAWTLMLFRKESSYKEIYSRPIMRLEEFDCSSWHKTQDFSIFRSWLVSQKKFHPNPCESSNILNVLLVHYAELGLVYAVANTSTITVHASGMQAIIQFQFIWKFVVSPANLCVMHAPEFINIDFRVCKCVNAFRFLANPNN